MCVGHRNLTWTLTLLFLSGALCSQWKVEYQQQHICAVKGSSVVIPCSFYYPDKLRVKTVMWGHGKNDIFKGPFILDSEVPDKSSRFQYIGNKRHNCSLKINQVEHNDAGEYTFRFITDKEGKWTGVDGSTLKVADLNVSVSKHNVNGATKEGDSVKLTCRNGCDGDHLSSAFSWLKNGEIINKGPVLYLSNMSSTNSGNYTCSLKTHTGTTSEIINIDVEYAPKNTTVSVSPSMEVDAGGSTTLICSSHANPPVENYTWFKINENDGIVAVGPQPVFFPRDGGQYLCRATNKHGSQNSSVVTVKVEGHWATLITGVLIILTAAAVLIVTTVMAVTRLKRKRTRAPEADCEGDTQNEHYVNWPFSDDNLSQESNRRDGASVEVIYATVEFHTQRKLEQQLDSRHSDVSVIYSTVCRKQPLNPSYLETLDTKS
ncbi:B-cell receptor CD22-like [Chelmon rostratus]|uniref:B-cell receptor CD22-like n=1 Tax=Chelmon rostratus TaxID=109905 RepID=UPI001BECB1E9|nr:B-cell receptor CD22-like [Chelmon rostratus]